LPTVTFTGPVEAPPGTETTILVVLQLVGDAGEPLNRTTLVPCVAPKLRPVMVTTVPTAPESGVEKEAIVVERFDRAWPKQ